MRVWLINSVFGLQKLKGICTGLFGALAASWSHELSWARPVIIIDSGEEELGMSMLGSNSRRLATITIAFRFILLFLSEGTKITSGMLSAHGA